MVHQSGDFTPPPVGQEFLPSKPSEQSQVHEPSGKEQGRVVKTLSKQDSNLIKSVQSYVNEKIHPPQKNTLPAKEYKKFKFSKTSIGKVFSSIMKRIRSLGSSKMRNKSSVAKEPHETAKTSETPQPETLQRKDNRANDQLTLSTEFGKQLSAEKKELEQKLELLSQKKPSDLSPEEANNLAKLAGTIAKLEAGLACIQHTTIGKYSTAVYSDHLKAAIRNASGFEVKEPATSTTTSWTSATPTTAAPKTPISGSAKVQTSGSTSGVTASRSKLPLEEEVQDEVERFLFPYLTGQITAETDNPNRGPLVDAIVVKLAEKGFPDLDAKRSEIEAIALKAYFNEAARGIGRQLGNRKPSKEEMQEPVRIMAQALVPALAIDFPNLKFSAKEIEPQVQEAIDTFNRNAANLEAEISMANEEREESRVFQKPRKERVAALLEARKLKGELFLTEAEHAALDVERAIYDNNQVQIYGRSAELTLFLDPKNLEVGTNFSLQPSFRGGKFHTLIDEKEGKETFSKIAISLAQIKATEEFRTQLPPGWKEASNNAKLADLGVQVFQDPDKNNFIFNDLGQLQMLSQKELKKLIKERS
ncbi:MAG: hypothetical protein CK425_05625 [Parachlamydia sp.]|nr:MAG: hypothetical protein CK425_05625 [Parachlamydia sp.]